MRDRITVNVPILIPQPRARVTRIVVAPRGLPQIGAMTATPEQSQGLTLYFVGFNTALGPWEAAKCAIWAALTHTTVVTCEIPGFSRYEHHLPARERRDLMDGDPASLASATLACLRSAAAKSDLAEPERIDILAYSTGCSLAAAALPAIQASYSVGTMTLIEPVSIISRTLGRLTVHNTADLIRALKTVPPNIPTSWVRQAGLRQFREPKLHFSQADFLALLCMLTSDDTRTRLKTLDLGPTHLVRGALSKLCPEGAFDRLDTDLGEREVPGHTSTVAGLGHQLWHCLPAIDALARTLK